MIVSRNQTHWKAYLSERSEEAFNQVVADHVDLVYGTALRSLAGDIHLAKDATQSVFVDLARKRPKLESDAALAGWLHRHARFTASKMVRTEQRRRQREQKYEHMKPSDDAHVKADLEQVTPHLDECLHELGESDRETLLLRFFQKQSLEMLGEGMGVSADAAQKRVRRALDKLKTLMENRGVTLSVASLSAVMTSQAAVAAPVGLAVQVASASLITSSAQVGWPALLTHLNQHLIAMKTSYIVSGAVTLAVTVPLVYQYQKLSSLKEEQAVMRQELNALDAVSTDYAAWQKAQGELVRFEKLQDELNDKERLSNEVNALKADDAEQKLLRMAELNDAKANLDAAEKEKEEMLREIEFKKHQVKVINSLKYLGLAARIYATDHGDTLPTDFEQIESEISVHEESFKETPLDGFEYFKHERPPHETEPNLILFREVEPRFDGKFYYRAYTFCDGSVQVHTSQNADFSDWEKQHTATLENLPEWLREER